MAHQPGQRKPMHRPCYKCQRTDLEWRRNDANTAWLPVALGESTWHECKAGANAAPAEPIVQTVIVQQTGEPVDFSEVHERIDNVSAMALQARQMAETVDARFATLDKARTIEVHNVTTGETVNVGRQHRQFDDLLAYASTGLNLFLRGPAGSTKTTSIRNVAKAFGRDFVHVPLGPQTSESKLLGYMDANGKYVRTLLRDAVEHGRTCCLDEMDACNAGVLTIVNEIVDAKPGTMIGFPDGMIEKHADCQFFACANTYGRGADAVYVGRAQLDGATLDRYTYIDWDYDWSFTEAISGNVEWTRYVQKVSETAATLKQRVVIGPRAALHGARLLAIGRSEAEAADACIWRPIGLDIANKIKEAMAANHA